MQDRRNAKDGGWSTCRARRPLSTAPSAALGGSAVLLEWRVGRQVLCESRSTATSASPLLAERTSAIGELASHKGLPLSHFHAPPLPRTVLCSAVHSVRYSFIQYNVPALCWMLCRWTVTVSRNSSDTTLQKGRHHESRKQTDRETGIETLASTDSSSQSLNSCRCVHFWFSLRVNRSHLRHYNY